MLLLLLCVVGLSQGQEQHDSMVKLDGGKFKMGTNAPDSKDGEGPAKQVTVNPFAIDKYPVTNKNFREYVRATKYKSEAESFGWSFVFEDFVTEELKKKSYSEVAVCTMVASYRKGILASASRARLGDQGEAGIPSAAGQLE